MKQIKQKEGSEYWKGTKPRKGLINNDNMPDLMDKTLTFYKTIATMY